MQSPDIIQTELQCSKCAGQRSYDPAQQCLICTSCGTPERLDTPDDHTAQAEYDHDPEAQAPDVRVRDTHTVHHCQTCGGDVIFVGAQLSERCTYCDGPVVRREGDAAFETMALIPCLVPRETAQSHAEQWVKKRRAAPGDLIGIVAKARAGGIYVPFWTFDSDVAIQYWASYRARRGKRSITRKTSGRMQVSFDDLLVPASPHVTPLIRDGILHTFDPRRLRPFRPGYVAGFAAEQHHQTVDQGLAANRADKDLLLRNKITRHIGKPGVHNLRYHTDVSGIRYRRILLPVWILHYTYRGKPMKVVVSGIDGRTYGERPFSIWKLTGYAAAASAATILFGMVWGGIGLL